MYERVPKRNTWSHGLNVLEAHAIKNSGGIRPRNISDVKNTEKIMNGEYLEANEWNIDSVSTMKKSIIKYMKIINPISNPVLIAMFLIKS